MNKNELTAWLLETICSLAINEPDKELSAESNIYSEFGLDSLDVFNLIMKIEDRFDIHIPEYEAQMFYHEIDTVEQIAEFILSKQKQHHAAAFEIEECITWLEKQGDKEPQVYETEDGEIITYTESEGYKVIEPKFKVGDWIINKFGVSYHIDSIDNKYYQVSDGKGKYNYFTLSKQDEMHLWTIQDAKDGDVLSFYSEYKGNKMVQIGIIKKYVGKHSGCSNTFKIYVGVNWDNNLQMGKYMGCTDIHPATKEQRDTLMKAINDAGYEWDAKKKKLKKLAESKFSPKTLKPFDKVLGRDHVNRIWKCNLFSHIFESKCYPYKCVGNDYKYCIPYNDDTKHLVGTTDEAPEYYRYWED